MNTYKGLFMPLITLLIMMSSLPGCVQPASPTPELTRITVQLSWLHQAEFAGFYAADQLGYFAAEGLQISFVEGGPEVDFIGPVVGGGAQFGVAQPADVILARASGKPTRSIAVIYRRSPIVFLALKSTGIRRPQDFVGQRIRSSLTLDQTLRAMMAKIDVNPDQYQIEYLPSEVELFASGDVPVWGGFINVFALDVQRAGYEINLIYPDDYGIHFYGDVLITTDDLIATDPDLVLRFTRAALKGWQHAVENPETTGAFVQKYQPNADVELENARMVAALPLINTGEDHIGWIKPEIWASMEQTLRDQTILSTPLDITTVYNTSFLEEIYK